MNKNKLKLTFLLLAAALPITLATWVFEIRETDGVRSTTNNGRLIIPVMDITEFDLRDQNDQNVYRPFEEMVAGIELDDYVPRPWMLMYLGNERCDEACEERLYYLRQLHIRLAGESERVERFYINSNRDKQAVEQEALDLFAEQFPAMKVLDSDYNDLQQTLIRTVVNDENPIDLHYIYVTDPVGNVMLYFTPENTTEEIYKDIDKLLDQSSLG